jgi:hypothetical protein
MSPLDEHEGKRLFDDGEGLVLVHRPWSDVSKFLTEDVEWPPVGPPKVSPRPQKRFSKA